MCLYDHSGHISCVIPQVDKLLRTDDYSSLYGCHSKLTTVSLNSHNTLLQLPNIICYYRLTTEICMHLLTSGSYQCGIMLIGGMMSYLLTHPVQLMLGWQFLMVQ